MYDLDTIKKLNAGEPEAVSPDDYRNAYETLAIIARVPIDEAVALDKVEEALTLIKRAAQSELARLPVPEGLMGPDEEEEREADAHDDFFSQAA